MPELDDKSQFKLIETGFRASLSALSEDHALWRKYDEFYLAKQWNTQRPSWMPNPVVNYVAYVVDQKTPQLTNNRPRGLILPTAQGDEEVAKLFTQVTDVIAERVGLDETITEVVPTGLLLGIGWFKVYWDNSKSGGKYRPDEYPPKSTVWKGDVCVEAPDPANIYHDPQAHKVEDCRYIIYAVPKTVEWVEEKFGVKVDAEQSFQTEIYDRPSDNQANNRVMLYEYWYKEKGTINVIYAAGGKVLKRIPEVYKHGRYPFVAFVPKKKRKSLTGIGEPRNIIDNQEILNKFIEMFTRNTMLTANPILLIDDTSGINPDTFTAKPGVTQLARGLKSGAKVMDWFQPPQISADVPNIIEKFQEFIERMSGVYDANTGETPGGVTAAAAIQMLVEQGSIPIKGIATNLHHAIKDVYELIIELVKENYTEERYIRITDENGGYQFQPFIGAKYAEIDLDVQVSAGASTPTSKAYIHQLGADLFQQGILPASMYVEMLDGLPNKEKVVAYLREQEDMQKQQAAMAAQPPDPMAEQAAMEQQMIQQQEQQAQAEQQEMNKFQQQALLKEMDNNTKLQIAALKTGS
ncbi:portal protein [Paenibacillus spongiae]|uniref:Phage portal protein n=1 Tax=Paenibacillus spongiae TaxID=2909671 RepID=A0ABY5SER9_9BACL|nr:phage portal protein [Paenibacillus spongiae]UVI31210.1 phage portal protein [Paenibacillus spongiae]